MKLVYHENISAEAAEARKRDKRKKELYRLNDEEADKEIRERKLQGNRYGISAAMFMQDGPFSILRLYLVIKVRLLYGLDIPVLYRQEHNFSSVDDISSLCYSL